MSKVQSPKKKSAASPKRQRNTASPEMQSRQQKQALTRQFTNTMLEQGEKDQLQLLLKEKEIELEHKLNTLIALNEKLTVFNDLKRDVAENQAVFQESEDAREKLQVTITMNAQKLKEDTEMKEKFQQQLQEKIQSLMDEIQE